MTIAQSIFSPPNFLTRPVDRVAEHNPDKYGARSLDTDVPSKHVSQEDVRVKCIGTGEAYSAERWLEERFGLVGPRWRERVRPKEGFQAEYLLLVSDRSTVLKLGWSPQVAPAILIAMMTDQQSPATP
ncbi:MAG: hypothetical protein INR62_01025 [Rhodospirillales bacterium]|nr:hypothetical protein [Acetobacter sp.]